MVPLDAPQDSPPLAHRLLAPASSGASERARSPTSERVGRARRRPSRRGRRGAPTRRRSAGSAPRCAFAASQRAGQHAQPLLLARRHRLRRRARTRRRGRVFTSQNTTARPRSQRRGRARPRARASCGRGPRSRRAAYQAATASSPRCPRPGAVGAAVARRRRQRSLPGSSSTLTSLNVTTRTSATKRVLRYMSHTQASLQLELEVGAAVARCGPRASPRWRDRSGARSRRRTGTSAARRGTRGRAAARSRSRSARDPRCSRAASLRPVAVSDLAAVLGRARPRGSDPLLLDLRGLPDAVAQVVELGPAHVAPGHDARSWR